MRLIDNTLLLFVLCLSLPIHSYADPSKYEVGLRANVLFGDGVPANDMIGYGIGGRYYLAEGWFIAAALETYTFDFERPIEVVGLEQDREADVIDAEVNTTVVSAALGRKYGADRSGFDWFWSIGIGAGFPDDDSVSGPLSTGGTFDLSTTSSTEFHLMAKLGAAYHFSPHRSGYTAKNRWMPWQIWQWLGSASCLSRSYESLCRPSSGATGDSRAPLLKALRFAIHKP